MSWIMHDPDEWESVVESTSYGKDPLGNPIGSASFGYRRRPAEEVAKIKAERRRLREESVLAEAAAILARRNTP